MSLADLALLGAWIHLTRGERAHLPSEKVPHPCNDNALCNETAAVSPNKRPGATKCYVWAGRKGSHPLFYLKSPAIDSPASALFRDLCLTYYQLTTT